jgi:anti-sigma factor RsiW
VNCRRARRLMHELLDGNLTDREALDTHLAECEACRAEMSRLRDAHAAVAATVACPTGEPDFEREMAGIWQAIDDRSGRAARPRRLWPIPVCAAAAVLLFCLGLWAGRAAWPREVTLTRIVAKPEIVEKTVEVPVEVTVVKERIVIKRVPVVKTRVVYRDRAVPTAPPLPAVAPGPVKAEEVVVRLDATPSAATSLVSHEIHSVTDVEQPSPSAPPAVLGGGLPDDGDEENATLIAWRPQLSAPTAEGGN